MVALHGQLREPAIRRFNKAAAFTAYNGRERQMEYCTLFNNARAFSAYFPSLD